jgi:hypothetical protein
VIVFKRVFQYFLDRMLEPKTWRALILIATAYNIHINPEQATAIVELGLLFAGGVGVAFPNKIKRKKRVYGRRKSGAEG